MLDIRQIPVLSDNYVYLIRDQESGLVGVVDPAVPEPVLAEADRLGWTVTHIFNTHHHGDHVGGNRRIKAETGCTIVGPRADQDRIPGIDVALGDGETYDFGGSQALVFDVPGHTRGHIAFWFAESDALFCGDTIFALGCGRMFEGDPQQFWTSLSKLRALPDTAQVYCAHEYTQANARFALSVDGANADLVRRAAEIDAVRAEGKPTVPSRLGDEKATNPFLRADDPVLAGNVGLAGADPIAVFAEIRARKDNF
ncbi:MAG: hydroxyacylglutathione hydrolase [Alphaproteobacteria bacterium]|nr:hydroxyacylglutathione hydrolase [Alphaproteobacteria bacterium]